MDIHRFNTHKYNYISIYIYIHVYISYNTEPECFVLLEGWIPVRKNPEEISVFRTLVAPHTLGFVGDLIYTTEYGVSYL